MIRVGIWDIILWWVWNKVLFRLSIQRSESVHQRIFIWFFSLFLFCRGSTGAAWCGSEYSGPPSYRAPRADPPVTVADVPITHDLKYTDIEPPTDQEKDPDEHLVTIVHTDSQPVIVTVSGSTALNETHTPPPSEIDILAHL